MASLSETLRTSSSSLARSDQGTCHQYPVQWVMRYLHLQPYENQEIQKCKLIGVIPMKENLPHFCVSLTALTKYGLSTCLPGTPAIWKNFDQALPIAFFAFLPFCVQEPVSILGCIIPLLPPAAKL